MMQSFILAIACCFTIFTSAYTQKKQRASGNMPDTGLVRKLLQQHPDYFQRMLDHPNSFRVQVVYTQINRGKNNKPSFREFTYNLHNDQYFYPASTVKMPVVFLALEKLNELNIKGLDRTATMITDSSSEGQDVVYTHPRAEDSRPSIEHYIKQILLVSDNDAFNRLYEFLGQEYIRQKLTEKGYPDAIIRHRLSVSKSADQNRHTNPVHFYDTNGVLLYSKPGQYNQATFPAFTVKLGKGYYSNGSLVNEPFNFSEKNRVYLQDGHHILQSVLFPEATGRKKRFHLTNDDYSFLKHWMSAYPKESKYPYYDSTEYWDAYCKFLVHGSEKGPLPANIRIFNKVGDAYGFLTDITYVADFENKVEFMLSATISCNSDGIYNDDQYDYETVGFPFMKNLGRTIYEYELVRKRKYAPDLSKFQIQY